MKEATLVLIKPDGLKKSLTGNILTRLSETKLDIAAAKMIRVSDELAREHYKFLVHQPFFEELLKYIKGEFHEKRKVMAIVYYGEGAIEKVREIVGVTNPEEADSLSIRGQYGRITTKGVYENVIHASTDQSEAEREIRLWFEPDEIIVDLYPTKKIDKNITKRAWVWNVFATLAAGVKRPRTIVLGTGGSTRGEVLSIIAGLAGTILLAGVISRDF